MNDERRYDDPWRTDITKRMVNMEAQHIELKKSVLENTEITKSISTNTDEIIQFFKAGKGFFTFMGYFGKIAKWTSIIIAAVFAVLGVSQIGGK